MATATNKGAETMTERETYPYYPPMADKPCDRVACDATYDEHYSCTSCGYPPNCHTY